MPFLMKIQPLDPCSISKGPVQADTAPAPAVKPVGKSRLKRLFERRQLPKLGTGSNGEQHCSRDGEFDPSSVCLAKMVQNFIEDSNEKQLKCGRNRSNCFNGSCNDSSDEEFDFCGSGGDGLIVSGGDACELLRSFAPCSSVSERNLLADAAKIVEKNKNCKKKDDCRRIVANGLLSLGYDASVCKSRWDKSPSFPAGEYEYVDVIIEGERLLVDIDFRSEFEIARSTKNYRAILQSLPSIFVGKPDRLQQIVAVVSEAAKQSLKKKGLHFPPWRKPEYMKSKWLSPYQRIQSLQNQNPNQNQIQIQNPTSCPIKTPNFSADFELIFGDKSPGDSASAPAQNPDAEEKITVVVSPWTPPAVKPRTSGAKIVTGLASVLKEKP